MILELVLGAGLVAASAAAIALALRNGQLTGERGARTIERDAALAAVKVATAESLNYRRLISDQAKRLRSARDELETCGDPKVRGRLAVDGIRSLLQALPKTNNPPTDPD
jgi:hypothetical protein